MANKRYMLQIIVGAIAIALLMSGGAHATIMIYDGLEGGSGDVDNVLFNLPTDVLSGLTVTGHLNTVDAPQVDFTSNEPLSAYMGGGQAHIVSQDTDGFNLLQISMHDTSLGFKKIQFNIEALVAGDISLSFFDQDGTKFSSTYAVSTSGENKFTAIADSDQLIMAAIIDTTIPPGSIAAIGDFKQVRLGEVQSRPIPEPATMLLFGTGLVGLAGARFRRKKK